MIYVPTHQLVREEFRKCMRRDLAFKNPDIGEIILYKPINNLLEISYDRLQNTGGCITLQHFMHWYHYEMKHFVKIILNILFP
jgi:hypothetical protein